MKDILLLAKARQLAVSGEAQKIRDAAGLSLRDIAAAVGVSQTTVWRWERGAQAPHGPGATAWALLLRDLQEQAA
jgi:DNA-binding transcriptional regulator YiaG